MSKQLSPSEFSAYFSPTPEALALIKSNPKAYWPGLGRAYSPKQKNADGVLSASGTTLIFTSNFRKMVFYLKPGGKQFTLEE